MKMTLFWYNSIITDYRMGKIWKGFIVLLILVHLGVQSSFAAVGCTLNDPDRDVKRIFPDSTGYKTTFITIEERGGEVLKREIEDKLQDKFDPIYESLDVPYAYYTILKGKETIGRIHGVNQKGIYGGIQLILATDVEGKIVSFYYQKISSPEARRFRDVTFTDQFKGLTLTEFHKTKETITDPSDNNHEDFLSTMRGIKKNLILLDIFILRGDYDE